MKQFVTLILLISSFGMSHAAKCDNESLKDGGAIDRFIDGVPADSGELEVMYDATHFVECGNELPPDVVQTQPQLVTYDTSNDNCDSGLYAVILLYLKQEGPIYCGWMLFNIPAEVLMNGYSEADKMENMERVKYDLALEEHDDEGTGWGYFVYCQGKGSLNIKYVRATRKNLNLQAIVENNQLQIVAVSYFYVNTMTTTLLPTESTTTMSSLQTPEVCELFSKTIGAHCLKNLMSDSASHVPMYSNTAILQCILDSFSPCLNGSSQDSDVKKPSTQKETTPKMGKKMT